MKKSNSMAQQLFDVNRLNDNALKFMQAIYEAITSDKENITTTLDLGDGSTRDVIIPSNIFLKSEVERMKASFENMIGLGTSRVGTIVSINDGANDKLRNIILSTFKKALDRMTLSEMSFKNHISVSQNPLIDKLLSPLTHLDVELPERFNNEKNVVTTKFFVENLDGLSDGMSYSEVRQYLSTNNVSYTIKEDVLKLNPTKQRFYGDFMVMSITSNDDDTLTCRVDKLTYSDSLNIVEDSRELQLGDELITSDGLTLYKVTRVVNDGLGIYVTIKLISGLSALEVGIGALQYRDNTTPVKTASIPIKGQDKIVLFISSLDDKNDVQGVYSDAKILDTDSLKILSNGIEFNFNTYYASNILGLGEYLESVVQENTVPRALASDITKPELDDSYFKVVQVNKHITNTADSQKLKRYSAEKQRLRSQILKTSDKIYSLRTKIGKGQYKSKDEKSQDESALNLLINKLQTEQSEFSSTVDNIASLASFANAPKASPKYRVLGFWEIDEPTSSITGDLQRIVQYNIRYKYVPTNSDVSEPSSIMVGDIDASISSWNELKSVPLKKTFDVNRNKFVWDSVNISDADVNNINQVEIPISYGENVIIQVQAIGEAGYPSNPILSEWSSPIKVSFPEELAQDEDIKSIVEDNKQDLINTSVNKEFESRGIDKLMGLGYTEQERYFPLGVKDIASGQFTTEQKTISLEELIKSMQTEIISLRDIVNRRTTSYSVELVTGDRTSPINKLQTIEVFAGNYTDEVDVNVESNYGAIVEKEFYIKLINNNANTADITSISSGLLTGVTDNNNYKDVGFAKHGTNTKQAQKNGQIIYLRNRDVSGSNELVYVNNSQSSTEIDSGDKETTTVEAEKTIVEYDGSSFNRVKLSNASTGIGYVAMSINHPLYQAYLQDTTNSTLSDALVAEFERIQEFNDSLLEDNKQQDLSSIDYMGFVDNDKYILGRNSTGARLFMRLTDIQNIQVSSSDSSASIQLHNGEQNALLIPVVFQFRMIDILGRINGDSKLSLSASNIEYKKKMGVDLIVGNELFKFDIVVSAKFRKTTLSVTSSETSQVISAIDTQSSNRPNIL
ncbi:hypothetical protein BPT24_178 [Tenacibaculum phage pT24]|uniref:Uncharacterized protein n=1 Tax=Tenacibaculum phage pT24 TaxID=1880590 RepID=A0A1B4XWW8_9CAUD|nr:hypothetical protein HYP10_gp178 [Tenacibaculum phage pT24]BAV39303.1 hypothetical protein BPT24_178 [Tenacibaculum phage pT24]